MPRPEKITPERIDTITRALEHGLTQDNAARVAGIAPSTFYAWIARGAHDLEHSHPNPDDHTLAELKHHATTQGITPPPGRTTKKQLAQLIHKPTLYSELSEAVTRARAVGEDYLVQQVRAATGADWRAAAWLLEHSFGYAKSPAMVSEPVDSARVDVEQVLAEGREIVKGLAELEALANSED